MKAEGKNVAAIQTAARLSRPATYDVLKTEPALQNKG
jgi:hypothetical protein